MKISPQHLWNQVLERLQLQLTPPAFDTWIKTAKVQAWQDNCLVIQAENPFVLNHLQKNYLKIIADAVQEIFGYPVEIQLTVAQGENLAIVGDRDTFWSVTQFTSQVEHNSPKSTTLNPKYSFSRFVVGPTNRMADAASLAVAESPGREFNPLFLCGGVGLGKTHLMQAIARYRLEMYPKTKVFYVSTEQFTNVFNKKIGTLVKLYQN